MDGLFNLLSGLLIVAFFVGAVIYARGIRRLAEALDRLEATVDRMEAATQVVAEDLAASIGRADAADSRVSGASADAALRTGEDPGGVS